MRNPESRSHVPFAAVAALATAVAGAAGCGTKMETTPQIDPDTVAAATGAPIAGVKLEELNQAIAATKKSILAEAGFDREGFRPDAFFACADDTDINEASRKAKERADDLLRGPPQDYYPEGHARKVDGFEHYVSCLGGRRFTNVREF